MAYLEEYTKLEKLGEGGFAEVFKVRHNKLGYIRAIRELKQPVTDENDKIYQSFLKECQKLLRIGNGNQSNIVHIYQPRLLDDEDLRKLKQKKALVEMDYVEGRNLYQYLKDNKGLLLSDEILRFVCDISSALAYCHEDIFKFCMDKDFDGLKDDPNNGSKILIDKATRKRLIEKYGVVHNDIHDGNIMRRDYDGSYVLLDFGLAIDGEEVVTSSKTKNGRQEYFAPERFTLKDDPNRRPTPQMDIYSFGILIYQMLAGGVPFMYKVEDKMNSYELEDSQYMRKHSEDLPPAILPIRKAVYESANPGKTYEKDYPQWLEKVIFKCLEKKPEDRFANGKELHEFVKQQMKQSSLLNNEEYRTVKEANEKLTHDLSRFSNEKSQLESHINALAKQLGTASSELEKTKNKAETLEKENEKLTSEKTETSGVIHKQTEDLQTKLKQTEERNRSLRTENNSLQERIKTIEKPPERIVIKPDPKVVRQRNIWTGIALFFAVFVIFMVFIVAMNEEKIVVVEPEVDVAAYEETISGQQIDIESLKNENTILQNDLKTAQSNGGDNAALVQKTQKINELENEKKTLQDNLKNANAEITKLKKQPKPADNTAALAKKDETIKSLQAQITNLKSEVSKKEKEIKLLRSNM